MKKDFKKWHNKKALINERENRPGFHEREIWWCAIGVNVGFEQDGGGEDFLRPVIVFRKFNNEILWGIPLTQTRKNNVFYFGSPKKKAQGFFALIFFLFPPPCGGVGPKPFVPIC